MILTTLLLLSAVAPQQDPWTPLEGIAPAQWRLTWTEDPAHRVTISWSTREKGSKHIVRYDIVPRAEKGERHAHQRTAQQNGAYTLNKEEVGKLRGAYYHHARIQNLKPSTTYWFQIESDGVRSPELHFQTAPADDRPFRLVHGGDSRSGHTARRQINTYIGLLADEFPDLIAFAHGGDYILWGELWTHWRPWLSHHELTTSPSGRVLPMIPTRGNHDPGPLFDQIFDGAGDSSLNYYTIDLTPKVSLITLNSEISAAGDQAKWLERELRRLRPKRRWLLAQYHRAIYPAVKNPAAMKEHWVPLFEKYDLDIALESDGHAVKRTVPIRAEALDPTGVVYIGEGGLGVPQREAKSDRWFLQEPGMSGSEHHVVLLEFGEGHLTSRIFGLPESLRAPFTPEDYVQLIPADATWRYLAGSDPEGDTWRDPYFDDSAWLSGAPSFGFGEDDETTHLHEMRSEYSRVYLRASFDPQQLAGLSEVCLAMRYDDGFIAYLNGVEVTRSSVGSGSGPDAEDIDSHEARQWELFPIASGAEILSRLGEGPVILAIEGHNKTKSSSDFRLEPCLIGPPLGPPPLLGEAVILDELRLVPRAKR